jgi:FtsZ-binding cell division protein ZapB
MIRFQFFPRSQGITKPIQDVITCFEMEIEKIKSPDFNLSSNEVLEKVRPHLEKINSHVKQGNQEIQKLAFLFYSDLIIK